MVGADLPPPEYNRVKAFGQNTLRDEYTSACIARFAREPSACRRWASTSTFPSPETISTVSTHPTPKPGVYIIPDIYDSDLLTPVLSPKTRSVYYSRHLKYKR